MEVILEKLEITYNYLINYLLHTSKNENKFGYFKTSWLSQFHHYILTIKQELLH